MHRPVSTASVKRSVRVVFPHQEQTSLGTEVVARVFGRRHTQMGCQVWRRAARTHCQPLGVRQVVVSSTRTGILTDEDEVVCELETEFAREER